MEFRYRAGDRRQPSGLSYFSQQAAIQAASNLDHGQVWGQNRSLGLTTHDEEDDVIQRQLEKEEIRREIVYAEERRKLLEAEVRWELVMEQRQRLMSMQQQQHHRSNVVDGKFSGSLTTTERFAFMDRVCGGSATEQHRRIMSELNHSERRSVFEEKEKPNTNLSGEKRKRNTTTDLCHKKPGGEWGCALCKVSATSQKGFNDHLQGKKHKAMEKTLRAKNREASKPKLSNGDFNLSLETELVKEVKKKEEKDDAKFEGQRNTNLSGEERKRNTTTDLCRKKPDGEWSCALCKVIATSQKVFSDHLQGKRHKAMEETLRAKNREASKPKLSGDLDLSSETELVKELKKKEDKDDAKFEGQRKENVKKLKFWCEMCGVGSHSSVVMEAHNKGKKHMLGLKKKTQSGLLEQ